RQISEASVAGSLANEPRTGPLQPGGENGGACWLRAGDRGTRSPEERVPAREVRPARQLLSRGVALRAGPKAGGSGRLRGVARGPRGSRVGDRCKAGTWRHANRTRQSETGDCDA